MVSLMINALVILGHLSDFLEQVPGVQVRRKLNIERLLFLWYSTRKAFYPL